MATKAKKTVQSQSTEKTADQQKTLPSSLSSSAKKTNAAPSKSSPKSAPQKKIKPSECSKVPETPDLFDSTIVSDSPKPRGRKPHTEPAIVKPLKKTEKKLNINAIVSEICNCSPGTGIPVNGTDPKWLPSKESIAALLGGWCRDPHAVLGMHHAGGDIVVRVFDPYALSIRLVWDHGSAEMVKMSPEGLFVLGFPGHSHHFAYQLEKHFDHGVFTAEDSYCFLPQIGELDLHLFNEGTHENVYEFMGAHLRDAGGVPGVVFCVWAPNAERVSVVGDFNCWDGRRHPMREMGMSGIWELFIPRLGEGEVYKYEIRANNGDVFAKLDPYAYFTEKRPHNAGIVNNSAWDFEWSDSAWIQARASRKWRESPMNIYEVHLASWQGPGLRPINHDNENDHHNYRELAHALADYVVEMGYTHIELMPILEHPLDISWGYQVSAYYAPTARHGTPDDFAYFVNHLHKRGIGVLLDWVPAHFPKDAFSLGRFDGTALYEHADPRKGEHQDWGTYIFNFGRHEVVTFLLGNALYWLEKFHIDGLRVDAVASMLYLDYSRKEGEWIPNQYGGNENIEAIDFLRHLNCTTNRLFPGTLLIAEESTAWPGVSHPTYSGGLGFNFKWNMGWMHDVLSYFQREPIHRAYHQNDLTLPLLYFPTENFILPLSHDEVVHGKRSLLDKMPGDYWRKFANLRALYAWMITHPGKKLLFMGGEFGQWIEWNCKKGLDWLLLEYESHRKLRTMVCVLNHLYKKLPALWEDDFSTAGFQWIDASNYRESIVAFVRWNKAHTQPVLIVMNLTPTPHACYQVGVPFSESWVEVLNTDDENWGGSGIINPGLIQTIPKEEMFHGQFQAVSLNLPPLGACILVPASQSADVRG